LRLKLSGQDAKWRELESVLDHPIMHDPVTGSRRKILIFTEPRDTLDYLAQKIGSRLGDPASIVVIHGGVAREARRAAIAAFNSDPVVRAMIANDAAGEGVNLQRGAHLMVNYDLPWNPNRLEQRFGRIHRIGQTEVCHLWNLCAANTREGEVYRRLRWKSWKRQGKRSAARCTTCSGNCLKATRFAISLWKRSDMATGPKRKQSCSKR
jgi:SNF2 family DNA or RNA helicase